MTDAGHDADAAGRAIRLVGDEIEVPCVDGVSRRYLNLDAAASTSALPAVASRVHEFLPWYSSVHRGAGYKSRASTDAYERARAAILRFAGRSADGDDIAIICRNTTEAINHLAYRLRLTSDDVVVTTVVEHHANLLPWARVSRRRFVECSSDGTFDVDDVTAALDATPRPKLLAITGASNVTGWMPPIDDIVRAAHERGIPVFLDAAQLAPHRPLPPAVDFVAWSGHKMYAPFGAGALVGPRHAFVDGDPFLAGGGAVDLVDLDEVVWTDPPEREEAGSPNVLGAIALHAAIDEFDRIGWSPIEQHDAEMARSASIRARDDSRRPTARPGSGNEDPAGRNLHRGWHAPCARCGTPERGVRHRRPPRMLLRTPVPPSTARSLRRTGPRVPRSGPAR